MKHNSDTPRDGQSTGVHIAAGVLAFVLAPHWCCCLAAAAQGEEGTPHNALSALSRVSDVGAIPQGIARPCQRTTMSAPLQGVLVEVLVKHGDRVKKGQKLAVMDNRVAAAAVNAAHAAAECTAEIKHAEHALALARSLLDRHSALQEAQAGAEFELEQARAQRDQAEATLAAARETQLQAKRKLQLEEARLEVHNIRAPFDGQVVRIHATHGTTLTPSDELLTIVNLDSLEVELHVPVARFGRLHAGESYRLWAIAPVSRPIQARLKFVSPLIDTGSKTFRCLFAIDNRDRQFPAGFGVRLDLPHSESYSEDSP